MTEGYGWDRCATEWVVFVGRRLWILRIDSPLHRFENFPVGVEVHVLTWTSTNTTNLGQHSTDNGGRPTEKAGRSRKKLYQRWQKPPCSSAQFSTAGNDFEVPISSIPNFLVSARYQTFSQLLYACASVNTLHRTAPFPAGPSSGRVFYYPTPRRYLF